MFHSTLNIPFLISKINPVWRDQIVIAFAMLYLVRRQESLELIGLLSSYVGEELDQECFHDEEKIQIEPNSRRKIKSEKPNLVLEKPNQVSDPIDTLRFEC